MPTARELLEQADALMRRNRLATAARPDDDGIPMLTEAVPVPPPASAPAATTPAARAPTPAAPAAAPAPVVYDDLDDVPLLTDAVEEIEAPSILEEPPDIEEPPDFDDPAVWTDTLTGAHSILGEDRIELPPPVPAAELTSSSRAPSPVASGVVGRSADPDAAAPAPRSVDTTAMPSVDATAILPNDAPATRSVEATGAPQVGSAAFDDRDYEALPRDDDVELPAVHVYDAPPAGPLLRDDAPDEPTVIAATPFEFASVDAPVAADDSAPPLERFDTGVDATLPGVAAHPAAPAAPAAASDDEQRWSALAEEIRMQVLQRIDLFTDTGLREQLGERLKPIVDRASADLVATINQHVGVLLRAYVAEAIEREIERWRADRP